MVKIKKLFVKFFFQMAITMSFINGFGATSWSTDRLVNWRLFGDQLTLQDFVENSQKYQRRIVNLADSFIKIIGKVVDISHEASNMTISNANLLVDLSFSYSQQIDNLQAELTDVVERRFYNDPILMDYWVETIERIMDSYRNMQIYFNKRGSLFKGDPVKEKILDQTWVLRFDGELGKKTLTSINSFTPEPELLSHKNKFVIIDGSYAQMIGFLLLIKRPDRIENGKVLSAVSSQYAVFLRHLNVRFNGDPSNTDVKSTNSNKGPEIIALNFQEQNAPRMSEVEGTQAIIDQYLVDRRDHQAGHNYSSHLCSSIFQKLKTIKY